MKGAVAWCPGGIQSWRQYTEEVCPEDGSNCILSTSINAAGLAGHTARVTHYGSRGRSCNILWSNLGEWQLQTFTMELLWSWGAMYKHESYRLADSHVQCVGKEQSTCIPAVNISGVSPRVRDSMSPQSAEYIRPTDSVKWPTIHSVPSSSGRSGSTLSGGAVHHKFCACVSPPTLYRCACLCLYQTCIMRILIIQLMKVHRMKHPALFLCYAKLRKFSESISF